MNNNQSQSEKDPTLCDVCSGKLFRIKCLQGKAGDCLRLREMGVHESACVRKISDNGALICGINHERIILSESLAQSIVVEEADELDELLLGE